MILSFFYNAFLSIGIFLFLAFKKSKKADIERRITLAQFKKNYKKSNLPNIWVHAVSLGEVKSTLIIIDKIKKNHNYNVCLSTVTDTGYECARNSAIIDHVFYMPIDYSWNIAQLFEILDPKLLIIVEGDFWWNMLRFATKNSVKVVLVNGRISQRSVQFFRRFYYVIRHMFRCIDKLCVQNECYKNSFLELGVLNDNIAVTRNLKYDQKISRLTATQKSDYRAIFSAKTLFTIASTHRNEEEIILDRLCPLWKEFDICCFFAPRHPERAQEVFDMVQSKGLSVAMWSQQRKADVVVIDSIGQLGICYELSQFAIVGGSYTKHNGGHNIIEPNFYDTPVFFGPYMYNQLSLRQAVLDNGSGDVMKLDYMQMEIKNLLQHEMRLHNMSKLCRKCIASVAGSVDLTYENIKTFL